MASETAALQGGSWVEAVHWYESNQQFHGYLEEAKAAKKRARLEKKDEKPKSGNGEREKRSRKAWPSLKGQVAKKTEGEGGKKE
mmetsp:Transcript_16031/g.41169  ORF Transcript_16031/g.41169 Transcript_16031/m.41169 type:complete len:84 (+) Transcript_16031:277-528(+)